VLTWGKLEFESEHTFAIVKTWSCLFSLSSLGLYVCLSACLRISLFARLMFRVYVGVADRGTSLLPVPLESLEAPVHPECMMMMMMGDSTYCHSYPR